MRSMDDPKDDKYLLIAIVVIAGYFIYQSHDYTSSLEAELAKTRTQLETTNQVIDKLRGFNARP
jgi:hypothetical protein